MPVAGPVGIMGVRDGARGDEWSSFRSARAAVVGRSVKVDSEPRSDTRADPHAGSRLIGRGIVPGTITDPARDKVTVIKVEKFTALESHLSNNKF